MRDKTIDELSVDKQELIREIDKKETELALESKYYQKDKIKTEIEELQFRISLLDSKLLKRRKELEFQQGGIHIELH